MPVARMYVCISCDNVTDRYRWGCIPVSRRISLSQQTPRFAVTACDQIAPRGLHPSAHAEVML